DERRPAFVAVLAREDELCACQPQRQVAEPRQRVDIAAARRADELLCLLAKLLEVHADLLREAGSAAAGKRKHEASGCCARRWAQPFPRTRARPPARCPKCTPARLSRRARPACARPASARAALRSAAA